MLGVVPLPVHSFIRGCCDFEPKPIDARPVRLSVSLLFCAHNEIECLPEKIENLRELKRACEELQILSYDDASDDGTYESLTDAADLLTVIRGPTRPGKAAGMKRLVRGYRRSARLHGRQHHAFTGRNRPIASLLWRR